MKTQSNSRPLAECTVISWIASWPGLRLVVAGLERGVGQEGGQRRQDLAGLGVGRDAVGARLVGSRQARRSSPWLAATGAAPGPVSSTGSATASLPKPSCVTKLSAALTSSSRFSSALLRLPSRSCRSRPGPTASSTCSMISRSVRPCVCSRIASISATKAPQVGAAPCRRPRRRSAQRLRPLARAASCSCSMRARADAARREVDDAQEAGVVVRVLDQPQVGQRVLDLGALEEAQAAVDACTGTPALNSALSITRLCALLR